MEPIRATRTAVNITIPSSIPTQLPIPKADIQPQHGTYGASGDDIISQRTASGDSSKSSSGSGSLRVRRAARWANAGGADKTAQWGPLKPIKSTSSYASEHVRSPIAEVPSYSGVSIKSPVLTSPTTGNFPSTSTSGGGGGGFLSHFKAPAASILPLSKGAAMKDVQMNARFYDDADVRAKLRLLTSDFELDGIVLHGFPHVVPSTDDEGSQFEFHDHSSSGDSSSLAGHSDDYSSTAGSAVSYTAVPAANREMTLKMTLTPASMRADEEVLYGWQSEQQFDERSAPPTPTTPTSTADFMGQCNDRIPPIPAIPDNIDVTEGHAHLTNGQIPQSLGVQMSRPDSPHDGNEGVSEFIPVGGLGASNSSRRIKNVFGGFRKKNQRTTPANSCIITSSSLG